MKLKYIATEQERLSSVLKEKMGISTGLMNRLKWQGKIFVNGESQFTNYMVQPGDVVTLDVDDPQPQYPAEDGELTVLYEDEHLLAVDKPAGMLIHPSHSCNTGTLANIVLGYYQKTGQTSAFHPLTRLDRDTFGVVLLAKNAHIHAKLNELLKQGKVEKIYHALTFGAPEADTGVIDAPIARRPLPSLLRFVSPEGKPSVTEYRVLERTQIGAKLALKPITGRTHQLRLHCAHKGFPILGDPQYGSPESIEASQALGLNSQLLCARKLRLPHPVSGELLEITSKMDARLP